MQYKSLPYDGEFSSSAPKTLFSKPARALWQHPQPQGNSLLGLSFANPSLGWVVGAHGIILNTADGGASWTLQNGNTSRWFAGIDFHNESIGWVAGEAGTVLHTLNGGSTWAEQETPTGNHLSAIFFINEQTGWAVGDRGTIIGAVNGGTEWFDRNSGVNVWLNDVFFINIRTGWAVGDSGVILKSTTGGETWSRQESGISESLSSVFFTTSDSGWAVGAGGTLLQSIDGGATWIKKPIATGHHLNRIRFLDSRIGWICGWYGTLFKTDNNGASWSKVSSGTRDDLEDIQFIDVLNGFVVGAWGTILKPAADGVSWDQVTSRWTSDVLYAVSFADSLTGWAAGENGTILHTVDGGVVWNPQASGVTYLLRDVFFANRTTGWAVGDSGVVLKTTNGGGSWSPQQSEVNTFLSSVYFLDEQRGWIAGSAGTILATSDGGGTWAPQETVFESRTKEWLSDIMFSDNQNGWAVGKDGVILRTTDSGASWLESRKTAAPDSIAPDSTGAAGESARWSLYWLLSVHFIDNSRGWAVGGNGTILQTSDGGISWNEQKNGNDPWTAGWLYTIDLNGSGEGWAVGWDGTSGILLHTDNFGGHWGAYESGSSNGLFGLHMHSDEQGWAVGQGGSIITFHKPQVNLENRITGNRYAAYALNTGVASYIAFTDSFTTVHPVDTLFTLQPDDEIGLFLPEGAVGGGGFFGDGTGVITVWGNDPQTPVKDGFAEGDVMIMRIWVENEKLEYWGIPALGAGSGNFIPDAFARLDTIKLQGFPARQPVRQTLPENIFQTGIAFENAQRIRVNFTSGDVSEKIITFLSHTDSIRAYGPSFPHPRNALEILFVSLDSEIPFEGTISFDHPPADSSGMINGNIPQENLTIAYFDSTTMRWIGAETERDTITHRISAPFSSAYSLWLLGDRSDDVITGLEDSPANGIPAEFTLSQNYPNPFNPVTTIRYALPNSRDVELKIYNILGQEIMTIVNGAQMAGEYRVQWNGRNAAGIAVPSGVYFYRLRAGGFIETKKMLLLR